MNTLTRPQFTASVEETKLIVKIAKRAVKMARAIGSKTYSQMTAVMDVEACHCNGCPLKLDALLKADDFNFSHDVFGIAAHIDRTTGELQDCFVPRFAK